MATALEESLPQACDWADASTRLDTATMIRTRAGEPARRGGPFDWEKRRTVWFASGERGTEWEIRPDFGRYGIIVARWDWPDWTCATLTEAKRIAEEIDARPKFPTRLKIVEHLPDD